MSRNVKMVNIDGNQKPITGGEVSLAVADSVVKLPAFSQDAKMVFVSVNTGPVQVRFDGIDPTISTGHTFTTGGYTWAPEMARAAKFIRSTGTSAYVYLTPVVW